MYWLIGVFTAFLTSFYMFRLWFMTFFGEYRGTAEDRMTNRRTIRRTHDAHGHMDMGMAGFMRVRG